MPTTRCSKPEAYSRLLRPQPWMPKGLRSGAKGEAVFADADRCPFRDAGLHGLLPIQATHSRVRSWSHNHGVVGAYRRTPVVMEGKFDKVAAPRPHAIPPAQKVRRLAKLSEQICGVAHSR